MDRPRHTKHDSSASTSFSLLSPVRRRRTVCLFIVLITLICVFGVPWELPAALKDEAGLSRGNVVTLAKRPAAEIFGLLHLVTRSERGGLDGPHAAAAATTRGGAAPLLDPAQPIALSVYAGGVTDEEADWPGVVEGLNEQFPVVVFSKTYCQFSKQAKTLLESYKLHPPPKIIEVDLRDDGDLLKAILTRLTKRSTFPNVLVRGESIGGSDDIHQLHEQGKLKGMLEKAGVQVKG